MSRTQDDSEAELSRLGWSDVQFLGWRWSDDGRDLRLLLRFEREPARMRELLLRWAAGMTTDLACAENRGGPLLSWDGSLRREGERWILRLEFPSAGSLRVSCSEFVLV